MPFNRLVGWGLGDGSWSKLEMRRLIQWHTAGFGSVAWLVGEPPSRGMFIAMKYGGFEAISESVALSFSGLPFAVRLYAVGGMPSFVKIRSFNSLIVVPVVLVVRETVLPVVLLINTRQW